MLHWSTLPPFALSVLVHQRRCMSMLMHSAATANTQGNRFSKRGAKIIPPPGQGGSQETTGAANKWRTNEFGSDVLLPSVGSETRHACDASISSGAHIPRALPQPTSSPRPPPSLLMVWYFHVVRPVLTANVPLPLKILGLWLKEVSSVWVPLVRHVHLSQSATASIHPLTTRSSIVVKEHRPTPSPAALDFLLCSPLSALLEDVQRTLERRSSHYYNNHQHESIELCEHLGVRCCVLIQQQSDDTFANFDDSRSSLCTAGDTNPGNPSTAHVEDAVLKLIPADCGIQYDALRKKWLKQQRPPQVAIGILPQQHNNNKPHQVSFLRDCNDIGADDATGTTNHNNCHNQQQHHSVSIPIPVFAIVLGNPGKFMADMCNVNGLVVYRSQPPSRHHYFGRSRVEYHELLRRNGIVGAQSYHRQPNSEDGKRRRTNAGIARKNAAIHDMFDMDEEVDQNQKVSLTTQTLLLPSSSSSGRNDALPTCAAHKSCESVVFALVTDSEVRRGRRLAFSMARAVLGARKKMKRRSLSLSDD